LGIIAPFCSGIVSQTGREEIWPSSRNATSQLSLAPPVQFSMFSASFGTGVCSGRNEPRRNENFIESRNSCSVKVGGVGVEGMMTFKKVEHVCENEEKESMYGFTGVTTRF